MPFRKFYFVIKRRWEIISSGWRYSITRRTCNHCRL